MIRRVGFIVWLSFLLCLPSSSLGQQPIPELRAWVTDLTGTLTAGEKAQLERKIEEFERTKGSQLYVLIVSTVQPEEIEQYSIRVVEKWALGRKKIDDGALLLVAKNDRRLRIEVGRGLEGVLTDAGSKRIIAEIITPQFKAGNFYGGIDAGLDAMIALVKGEPLPAPSEWPQSADHGPADAVFVLLFGLLIFSGVLRLILGKGLGGLVSGLLAFAIAAFFISFLVGILAGLFFFVMTFFGAVNSRGLSSGGWSSGGRSSGWSSGGGGFRGGGGGTFAGGGASGSW